MDFDKAALDRWITREPPEEPDEPNCTSGACTWPRCGCDDDWSICDYCGKATCECDKLQAEQEQEAQRLLY